MEEEEEEEAFVVFWHCFAAFIGSVRPRGGD